MCLKFCFHRSILGLVLCCGLAICHATVRPGNNSGVDEDEKSSAVDPVYEPGGDIRPPKLIHYVEPKFSRDSKEAFVEGTVKISTIVTVEGEASECHVTAGLTEGQDKTAMEALKQWRFQPGTKEGKPVRVRVTVEVGFHLL